MSETVIRHDTREMAARIALHSMRGVLKQEPGPWDMADLAEEVQGRTGLSRIATTSAVNVLFAEGGLTTNPDYTISAVAETTL